MHEPCQIRPVRHSQSLLNWLREIQNSPSAECTDRAAKTRRCETNLRKGIFFSFSPLSQGAPEGRWSLEEGGRGGCRRQQELPISFALKRSVSVYSIRAPTEGKRSQHFDKIPHRLALTLVSLAKGLERINLICSKSFALRLPFPPPRKRPCLAAPSCLLCKFHVGRVHTSGLA